MSDPLVEPEVFAGAGAETARDEDLSWDVEIAGSFSAERLRHVERPSASARVTGEGGVKTLDDATRENLPASVEVGQTYTGVRGRRHVGGRLRPRGVSRGSSDGA